MNESFQNQNQMPNQNPNNNPIQNQYQGQVLIQQNAPYAVASLILGIFSLLTGCLFVGLILGIIGLVLANKGTALYIQDPAKYKGYGMLHAGKVLSILGIVFGAIGLVASIVSIAIGGSLFFVSDIIDELLWF
ncbi:MAG: hypothetical protein MJZ87_11980 [Bacteroidales bacterium]|nr:hypothetical protein [Bacteroidales bacterium]